MKWVWFILDDLRWVVRQLRTIRRELANITFEEPSHYE